MEGKIIIVRSRDAGCLVGEFVSREGADITLCKARQLWQWKAKEAGTLIGLATDGAAKGGNKWSQPSAGNVVVIGACTLIECSDRAIETFGAVSW
jgi:hypothetical protein